jgi:hypothetical protein
MMRSVTDGVDDVLHRLLVALDRHEALALEVLARRHRQLRRVDVALALPVLVHPPQQEWSQSLYARAMAAASGGSMAGIVSAKSPREG